MALAKYYEDILDRLTEDLAEGVTGADIRLELSNIGWPPSKPQQTQPTKLQQPTQNERLDDVGGRVALRQFLLFVTSELKKQKEIKSEFGRGRAVATRR